MRLKRDVGRSCGGCTGCCKPFPVPEVGKTHCGWCAHSKKGKGCDIYDMRPTACQLYACLWLNGFGDDSYRPDRLGVVLDVCDLKLSEREVGVLHVFEIQRHALKQEKIQELMEANRDAGSVVIEYRMQSPSEYVNFATWHPDRFSAAEKDEIRAWLNKRDLSNG